MCDPNSVESLGLQRCLLHLALLPLETLGAGAVLCFAAAAALLLPSVKGIIQSETSQHCGWRGDDCMLERKASGSGCIIWWKSFWW